MSEKYRLWSYDKWWQKILPLLFTVFLSLSIFHLPSAYAQERKPCGTTVLARRHQLHKRDGSFSAARTAQKFAPRNFEGPKRGLIILVSFPDIPFQEENPNQLWTDIANTPGYAENGAHGSVSDYFRDQSYDQFHLTFDVVGPVEVAHEHDYYGQNIDWGDIIGWFDQNVGELVEEACRAVDKSVRFSDYDWDGDGEVEQVFLLYSGHGENDYWSRDTTVIWPHMASLSEDWAGYEEGLVLQGVRIDTYACSNEINRNGEIDGMGTFCHEFSHCLGLPDLYNTEKGYSVVGAYDLMDQGCYNDKSWCPVGYSSYERYACGWLTPIETDDPTALSDQFLAGELQPPLLPLHESPDAYIYRLSPDANDYYLIENRQRESWDSYIPRAGLLVWHIDYDEELWRENIVNNDPDHLNVERMTIDEIPVGISRVFNEEKTIVGIYDLYGRSLLPSTLHLPPSTFYIIRYSDGTTQKVFR
jgi:M6 family metalloprotease-like protein